MYQLYLNLNQFDDVRHLVLGVIMTSARWRQLQRWRHSKQSNV